MKMINLYKYTDVAEPLHLSMKIGPVTVFGYGYANIGIIIKNAYLSASSSIISSAFN